MSFLIDEEIATKLSTFFPGQEKEFAKNSKGCYKQLQPSSFELRLGKEIFLSSEKELVLLGKDAHQREYIGIKPGDFAVLLTEEKVKIPDNFMALISIKATFKNKGLVNISGFHVDPGFSGHLTFSVYNAGPSEIFLRYLEEVFVIFFSELNRRCKCPYDGDKKQQHQISSTVMNNLSGKSVSPFDLATRISQLEQTVKIQWGFLVAFLAALIPFIIGVFKSH